MKDQGLPVYGVLCRQVYGRRTRLIDRTGGPLDEFTERCKVLAIQSGQTSQPGAMNYFMELRRSDDIISLRSC